MTLNIQYNYSTTFKLTIIIKLLAIVNISITIKTYLIHVVNYKINANAFHPPHQYGTLGGAN